MRASSILYGSTVFGYPIYSEFNGVRVDVPLVIDGKNDTVTVDVDKFARLMRDAANTCHCCGCCRRKP